MNSDRPRPDREPPPPVEEFDAKLHRELRALAVDYLRRERQNHPLRPTELVHDAWIRLSAGGNSPWSDKDHFFACAARAMRHILVDHARRHRAEKRGGLLKRVTLATNDARSTEARDVDVFDVDAALTRLAQLDARQARIVELRFFGGMTVEQVAAVIGISARTVASEWRVARAWLSRELPDVGTGG